MTLVKGPNGLVVDVAPTIASGLIGGGYVEAVDSDAAHTAKPAVEDVEPDDHDGTPTKPAGNASRGDWAAYALTQGFAEEQIDGLKQGEIRALFDE